MGKTTTVINLAHHISTMGQEVLIIDFDPQGNASSGIGIEVTEDGGIYQVLMGKSPAKEQIIKTSFRALDILPAGQGLSGAQVQLVNDSNRHATLANAIAPILDDYDFIFIDTPPSLGLLTLNALSSADSVFIPIQCEYFALEGISQLLKIIKETKQRYNPKLNIEGVALTMFDQRTKLSHEIMENVVKHFKEKTYQSIISRNIRITESPSHGLPIGIYDPKGIGSESYRALAKEFLMKNTVSLSRN